MAASKTKDGYLVTAMVSSGIGKKLCGTRVAATLGNSGHNGRAQEQTTVCDFRRAGGFYVLWNEYRPSTLVWHEEAKVLSAARARHQQE